MDSLIAPKSQHAITQQNPILRSKFRFPPKNKTNSCNVYSQQAVTQQTIRDWGFRSWNKTTTLYSRSTRITQCIQEQRRGEAHTNLKRAVSCHPWVAAQEESQDDSEFQQHQEAAFILSGQRNGPSKPGTEPHRERDRERWRGGGGVAPLRLVSWRAWWHAWRHPVIMTVRVERCGFTFARCPRARATGCIQIRAPFGCWRRPIRRELRDSCPSVVVLNSLYD